MSTDHVNAALGAALFADPRFGKFKDVTVLSQADVDMIAAWADGGAPKGAGPAPEAPLFASEWLHDRPPDYVVEMPLEVELPAQGEIPYVEVWMENPLKEDVFLEAVQVRIVESVEQLELAPGAGFARVPNIPPHATDFRVTGIWPVHDDVTLYGVWPHMHFRGKDMTYIVSYPDGTEETLLHVPNYDFNWQIEYDFVEPLKVPAGSTLKTVGHFDNSVRNRYNPSPGREVYWGLQSWDEMFFIFTKYTVDKNDFSTEN